MLHKLYACKISKFSCLLRSGESISVVWDYSETQATLYKRWALCWLFGTVNILLFNTLESSMIDF